MVFRNETIVLLMLFACIHLMKTSNLKHLLWKKFKLSSQVQNLKRQMKEGELRPPNQPKHPDLKPHIHKPKD